MGRISKTGLGLVEFSSSVETSTPKKIFTAIVLSCDPIPKVSFEQWYISWVFLPPTMTTSEPSHLYCSLQLLTFYWEGDPRSNPVTVWLHG